jgi:hypothetical protein
MMSRRNLIQAEHNALVAGLRIVQLVLDKTDDSSEAAFVDDITEILLDGLGEDFECDIDRLLKAIRCSEVDVQIEDSGKELAIG